MAYFLLLLALFVGEIGHFEVVACFLEAEFTQMLLANCLVTWQHDGMLVSAIAHRTNEYVMDVETCHSA